ncbi:hypothetical protein COCNU_10G007970 [Cocos nucifera]|uniref:Uncharacterized protein n=1 Tax=Cocos nucifera TaxID=13894 RepID=A0A8K0IMH1_COCNU|nr:hypothetical protein COCNU_10G007970 [Cocos nucifera]
MVLLFVTLFRASYGRLERHSLQQITTNPRKTRIKEDASSGANKQGYRARWWNRANLTNPCGRATRSRRRKSPLSNATLHRSSSSQRRNWRNHGRSGRLSVVAKSLMSKDAC